MKIRTFKHVILAIILVGAFQQAGHAQIFGGNELMAVSFGTVGSPLQSGFTKISDNLINSVGGRNVQLQFTTTAGDSINFYGGGYLGDSGSFTYSALYNSLVYYNESNGVGKMTLTIGGLAANTAYNLQLYSLRPGPDPAPSYFSTVFTDMVSSNAVTISPGAGYPYPGGALTGSNQQYSALLTVTTDSSGLLTIVAGDVGGALSGQDLTFNGFELGAIAAPEPSTVASLLVGCVFLLVVASRRTLARVRVG